MQIGFLTALAKILEKNNEIRIIAREQNIEDIIKKNIPDANILIQNKFNNYFYENIVSRAVEIEKKYSITISKLISCDRALGHGYLFNADRHPNIIRGWWPN